MFNVKIVHESPAVPDGWSSQYAVMVHLIADDWHAGDSLIIVSLHGAPVAMAHIYRDGDRYTLNALVSVMCGAGKIALGRAIAMARHDGLTVRLHSLRQSEGFYRHCGMREITPLEFEF